MGIFSALFSWETDAYVRQFQMLKNVSKTDQLDDTDAPEASGRALPLRPRRILMVDDEPAARVLAFRVFSEAGFEVTTVQSGSFNTEIAEEEIFSATTIFMRAYLIQSCRKNFDCKWKPQFWM